MNLSADSVLTQLVSSFTYWKFCSDLDAVQVTNKDSLEIFAEQGLSHLSHFMQWQCSVRTQIVDQVTCFFF